MTLNNKKKSSFFSRNGLSIVNFSFIIIFLGAQYVTGWKENNQERSDKGLNTIRFLQYGKSPHFIESTFENWESEFLQMALFVLLTVSLRQKGSAESKDFDKKEEVDRDPKPHKDAPWPVKKGGIWLKIYSNSLSIAFILLFLISFALHFYGSYKDYIEEQAHKSEMVSTPLQYLGNSKLWFESFQNWQSEFVAVFCIVMFTIWLRQKGSPQSKPVDAPYDQTGS